MKKLIPVSVMLLLVVLNGCKVNYSFTGAAISPEVKTIQINYFPNNAPLIEPGLSQSFTNALQDFFLQQTNLNPVKSGGDLQFEGEITDYRITPISATAQQTAAQNRLTIGVRVRFFNLKDEEDNFEKTFSFFFDYDASAQLLGSLKDQAFAAIFERITQDIFNASVAKW